jgi:DNA-binding transcriptional LysR family regulator
VVFARLADAEAELRALRGLEGDTLKLASFASAAASVLPLAVARFRDRYPAVELDIVMGDPVDSIPRLRAGELDLALAHDAMTDVEAGSERRSGWCSARPTSRSSRCSRIPCTSRWPPRTDCPRHGRSR